jgi:UDP-galactopyranose mutase
MHYQDWPKPTLPHQGLDMYETPSAASALSPARSASAREPFPPGAAHAGDLPCDLALCFSHLRWAFVYQRPQHLMSRLSTRLPLVYVEEPTPTDGGAWLERREVGPGLSIAIPRLPANECGAGDPLGADKIRAMLDEVLVEQRSTRPLLWYYTPMALQYSDQVDAALVVYDCMDELSAFRFAPPALVERERQLLARSDVVFTGGRSLYDKKRDRHGDVHLYPSGVDIAHFGRARHGVAAAAATQAAARPRVGYYGVIDERLDYDLIASAAQLRPAYQWMLIGPLAKVSASELPQAANLHYLGPRPYEELPDHLAGWDVAMMPFALNEATAHISPTKTPEYLAGGRPVVSTPIADVVRTYGDLPVVRIAADAQAFVEAVDSFLESPPITDTFVDHVDPILASMSWDSVFDGMCRDMARAAQARRLSRVDQSGPLPMEAAS